MMRSITALALGLIPTSALAAVISIASRAALDPNDRIEWNQFGPAGTFLDTPNFWTSTGRLTGRLSSSSPSLTRVDQGNGWSGGFAAGEELILQPVSESAVDQSEPVRVAFDRPVRGAGAQFQPRSSGAHTLTLAVYDPANELLGTFESSAPTNDVQFFGVLSDAADIGRIEVFNNTANTFDDAYAFGPWLLRVDVPEPSALALLGLGAAGLAVARRRCRSES